MKVLSAFIELKNQLEDLKKKEKYINTPLSIRKFHRILLDFINEAKKKVPTEALSLIEVSIESSNNPSNLKIEDVDNRSLLIKIRIPQNLERKFQQKNLDIVTFFNSLNQILLDELINIINLINKDWNKLTHEKLDEEIKQFILGISTIAILQNLTHTPKHFAKIRIEDENIEIFSTESNDIIQRISSSILGKVNKELNINGEYEPPLELFELIDIIFESYIAELLMRFLNYFKPYVTNKVIVELDIPRLITEEVSKSYDLSYIANTETDKYFEVINLILKAAYIIKAVKHIPNSLKILDKEEILKYNFELPDGRYNPSFNPEDYDISSYSSSKIPKVGFFLYYPGSKELVFQIQLVNTDPNIEEITRQLENFKNETKTIIKELKTLLNKPLPQSKNPIQLKHNILNLQKNAIDKWFSLKEKFSPTKE